MIKFKNIFALLSFVITACALVLASFALYVSLFATQERTLQKSDVIVLFGASVLPKGHASDALKDRAQRSAELFKSKLASRIIISGTQSVYGFHEADVAERILLQSGIPKDKIFKDYFGRSTCDSIKNLDKNKTYIFVSNSFHLAKINYLAKKLGIKNFYLSDSGQKEYKKNFYFIFREALAILYNILFFDRTCENGLKSWDIYFSNLFDKLLDI